jgi:hypothetical protein
VTVYRKDFPAPRPAAKEIKAAEPVTRSEPPRPMGKPFWLGTAGSPEEALYAAAVRRAFAPPRREPEPDPLYDFIWGE